MTIARDLIAVTLTLLVTTAAAGQATDTPAVDPASWAPEDALVYVGIADLKKLTEEVKRTAFYKLMQDPEAKESWGQVSFLLKLYEEFKKRLAESLDTRADRLENPFGGPMALYVPVPRGGPEAKSGIVLVAGVGNAELMKRYYDDSARKLREHVDNHEKISFGSYTIDQFTTETSAEQQQDDPNQSKLAEMDFDSDEAGVGMALDRIFRKLFSSDSIPEQLVLCLTEDRLIVASTPDDVKDVLRRERSGSSLADTEMYKTLLREFQPLGSVRMLVNLAGLFEIMVAVDGEEASKTLTMLGARSMRGAIGHVLISDQAFESKLESVLLLSGERSGLAKILSMKNRPVTPPASVSADNLIYASLGANPTEIIDELERMIRREDPAAADQLRTGLESMPLPDGETLNIRKELLENLREPLTFAMAFQRPYGPQSTRLRLSVGHRDKDAVARFLEKLSSLPQLPMVERELLGTPVYDIPFFGFSLAPTDDAILVGTTNAVDAALQTPTPQESLASDAMFKRAAALGPPEAWGVLYVDSRRMFAAALEMARNKEALMATQFSNPANMFALVIAELFTAGIDESRIDAAGQLAKYQGSTLITVATTPEGIRFTQIQLAPDTEESK